MTRVLLSVPTPSSFYDYFRNLVDWPPKSTSDAGELILVGFTLAVSFSIMIAFGQWWSR